MWNYFDSSKGRVDGNVRSTWLPSPSAHKIITTSEYQHTCGVMGSLNLGEETLSNCGQCAFKELVETVFKCVGTDDTTIMREENYSATATTILQVEEGVLSDSEVADVVTMRLAKHDIGVFILALLQNAVDQINLFLAHLDFNFLLKQLNHTLKNKSN
jgi:hypothetical protein